MWDNFLNNLGKNFNVDLITSKVNADIDMPITTDINASKKSISSQLTNTDSRSYQFAPVDARSLILTLNSPDASISKKDDLVGSSLSPNTSINPNQVTDLGATEIPLKISPNIGLNGLGGGTSLILYGIIGFGAYKLLTKDKKKK